MQHAPLEKYLPYCQDDTPERWDSQPLIQRPRLKTELRHPFPLQFGRTFRRSVDVTIHPSVANPACAFAEVSGTAQPRVLVIGLLCLPDSKCSFRLQLVEGLGIVVHIRRNHSYQREEVS